MSVTVDRGLLLSFSVGSRHNDELAVPHHLLLLLFFWDDTLFFGEANCE